MGSTTVDSRRGQPQPVIHRHAAKWVVPASEALRPRAKSRRLMRPGRSEASGPPALVNRRRTHSAAGRPTLIRFRTTQSNISYMTTGQPAPPARVTVPASASKVIIPTFNERENLPVIHRRLTQAYAVHVLVVDDSSPGCRPARRRAGAGRSAAPVMHRTAKNGWARRTLAGFA